MLYVHMTLNPGPNPNPGKILGMFYSTWWDVRSEELVWPINLWSEKGCQLQQNGRNILDYAKA